MKPPPPRGVLFLLGNLGLGGAERQAFELARRLPGRGWHAAIALAEDQGPLRQAARGAGIPVHLLGARFDLPRSSPRFWWNFASVARRIRCLAREEGCPVLHAPLFWESVPAAAARVLPRGPRALVCGRRNTGQFKDARRHYEWIQAAVNPIASAVVPNSRGVYRDTLRREKFLPRNKIFPIHNGLEVDHFAACAPADVAGEWPQLAGARPLVLVAAHFKRQKRHDVFLRALQVARREVPGMRGLLLGDDRGERSAAETLARDLGLGGAVVFGGQVGDIAPYLRAADIFCLSSDFEGMPNAVLEAMAAGLPVVATRTAGVDEVVLRGRTGFLCGPGDHVGLAAMLVRAARAPGILARMGARAQDLVRQRFSMDAMVDAYVRLYERVLAGQPPRGRGG